MQTDKILQTFLDKQLLSYSDIKVNLIVLTITCEHNLNTLTYISKFVVWAIVMPFRNITLYLIVFRFGVNINFVWCRCIWSVNTFLINRHSFQVFFFVLIRFVNKLFESQSRHSLESLMQAAGSTVNKSTMIAFGNVTRMPPDASGCLRCFEFMCTMK